MKEGGVVTDRREWDVGSPGFGVTYGRDAAVVPYVLTGGRGVCRTAQAQGD